MKQLAILFFLSSTYFSLSFAQSVAAPQIKPNESTQISNTWSKRVSKGFTLSPSFGAYYEGKDQSFTSNDDRWSNIWAYGFRLGYAFNRSFEIEANFSYSPTRQSINRQSVYMYNGFLLYNLNLSERFVPYILAGFGGLNINNEFIFDENSSAAYYGVGLRYFLHPKIALRGEFHAITAFETSHTAFWSGILFTVYGNTAAQKKPDLSTLDSDNDGIMDDKDQCPTQPETINQFEDEDGCPDSIPSNLLDSDNDGIMDDKDQCPQEPETINQFEDEDGCPDTVPNNLLDSDKDGITDDKDQCPKEPETFNSYQDDDGCPDQVPTDLKDFVGKIEHIFFALDSAVIQEESYHKLDASIVTLKKYPNLFVLIEGHTDSTGSKAYNDKLSYERAQSVKEYLMANGLNAKRLAIKGYGFSKPIADNATEEGRAKNRRIEFKLLTKPGQ